MRVLMISDVYFPRINGVSTAIHTYHRTLLDEGVEVRLIAPDYGDHGDDESWVVRIPARAVPNDPEDRIMRWSALLAAVETEALNADVIHIQTPFLAHYAGLKIARKLGVPRIATYHTLFEEYFQHYVPFLPASWLKRLARYISRRQCNAMTRIIVPSRAIEQRLRDYGVRQSMQILPTGVSMSQFNGGDGARFRARHDIAPERPVALFVGRVAFEKNITFLLESVDIVRHQHHNMLFIITGNGPAMKQLQHEVIRRKMDDNVMFLGYLERLQELPDCYGAANAFIFASRTETQGLVLIEAMAMGVPVVALSSMGTADILEAERGALVPEDDPNAFAVSLALLLGDSDLQHRLSQQGREYAKQWDELVLARRLAAVYR
ncbi:MAG: glycosyltransferase [Mariprofundales bacterium]|nr:glycosyltransferase [Mariprofundales bacterium]